MKPRMKTDSLKQREIHLLPDRTVGELNSIALIYRQPKSLQLRKFTQIQYFWEIEQKENYIWGEYWQLRCDAIRIIFMKCKWNKVSNTVFSKIVRKLPLMLALVELGLETPHIFIITTYVYLHWIPSSIALLTNSTIQLEWFGSLHKYNK